MPLVLDPPTAKFESNGTGKPVTLQLINYTERRFCFKIKSTNNDCYRVQPVFGFVNAENKTAVELTRKNGAPGWDYFVIEWRGCNLNEAEPWAPFQRAESRRLSNLKEKIQNEENEVGQISMLVQAR